MQQVSDALGACRVRGSTDCGKTQEVLVGGGLGPLLGGIVVLEILPDMATVLVLHAPLGAIRLGLNAGSLGPFLLCDGLRDTLAGLDWLEAVAVARGHRGRFLLDDHFRGGSNLGEISLKVRGSRERCREHGRGAKGEKHLGDGGRSCTY